MVFYGTLTDTDLYSKILGVEAPWFVTEVRLDIETTSIYVTLDFDGTTANFACPTCQRNAYIYDRRESRTWRHLDSCQFQTFVVASLPRVCCSEHRVLTASVPWAEPNSRFTLLFERFAITVLQATQVQSRSAELLRLSPGQVHDLMERAVRRGLKRRNDAEQMEHLGLDEKSFQEGHHYVSVLSDSVQKRVLDVVAGRTQEVVEVLFSSVLSEKQRKSVKSVTMDMWPAFQNARVKILPDAQTVHDRYHIAAYLNDAVDKTRRSEHRELAQKQDDRLSKTKYIWLRSDATLTLKQRAALEALTSLDLETAKVWALKESFRGFFACSTLAEGRAYFANWYEGALVLRNGPLTKVAQMLLRHLEGLLAYITHRVSNAAAEGLNAQIQRLKSNAKGFRKWENFRIAILFHFGKLELYPHKTP